MMKKEELKELEERIVNGYRISREEAGLLMEADLTELSEAADLDSTAFLWKCL